MIPPGSTVAVQQEDAGPLTNDTIIEKGDTDHNDQLYKLRVTKTG